ncbi:MAG: hypothetical protein Q7U28_10885 [Aquabacterium sp.]|nr:hypothetical protein [Aquabacterium sp.]
MVRMVSAAEMAEYLFVIFVAQTGVAVIANSLHLLAAGRFRSTGMAVYPVDTLSNLKTLLAMASVLSVIWLMCGARWGGDASSMALLCGVGAMYFFACLATSFLNGLLSASNARLYVMVPICTHLVVVLLAFSVHVSPLLLVLSSVLGAMLEAAVLFGLFLRASGGGGVTFSASHPPQKSAAASALLNSASPFILQIAAYGLSPSSYLALVYGQKIAGTLSSLGSAIVGALYFHLNSDAHSVRRLAMLGGVLVLVAVLLAQVAYPFPLQVWLGEVFLKQVGPDIYFVYMLGWVMLACNILSSIYYRKCLIEAPRSLLRVKVVTFAISVGAVLATHWGVSALVLVQLLAGMVEIGLYMHFTHQAAAVAAMAASTR